LKDASADFEPIGVFALTLSGPVLALPRRFEGRLTLIQVNALAAVRR
jgi:hypothetical protein